MAKSQDPVSIRLDAETEQRLRRLAHETGGTMSSVVREAVTAYGAAWDAQEASVVGNQTDRSERTGQTLRMRLTARGSARRPR